MDEQDALTTTSLYRRGEFIFAGMVTRSPRMEECLRLARNAAGSDLSVLITGESGTGKNLLAQAIHNASARSKGPYVSVNMSALSPSLLESELFGHERGAFTGADKQRRGHFELASDGTLVLDEIGDMSLEAQPKILHAVEYKQFLRLGGERHLRTDVRIVSLTNHDLDELVAGKRFRMDLLYRLREITIELPPLRERVEDIPILCKIMLPEIKRRENKPELTLSERAVEALQRYNWPGNLREFKSLLRRSVVLCPGNLVEPEHLGFESASQAEGIPDAAIDLEGDCSLAAAEKRQIRKVLNATGWNKTRSATLLGISRSTLDRKLAQYEIGR